MKNIITAALLVAFALAAPARADDPPSYVLPGSEIWELTSAGGEIYKIFVSAPTTGEPPKGGYPVLYVLDGNALFAAFAEARWRLQWETLGQSIVVGVGYPTDKAYDKRRGPDFMSPFAGKDGYVYQNGEKPKAQPGGKDYFLDFLTGPLRAEIAKRYKIDPKRQALFGHSYGGSFALHALYARPNAFSAIIAASSSIGYRNMTMLAEERAFAGKLMKGKVQAPAALLLQTGALEEIYVDTSDTVALAKRLEALSAYGLRTRLEVFADETHNTVPTRAVTPTLRFAFGGQYFAPYYTP